MRSDAELLRHYAEDGDQAAFAEFVDRHMDSAYSAALRVLGPSNLFARDVVQAVFTDAARKARALSRHATVAGWIHTSVRLTALDRLRRERRRQIREHAAAAMHDNLDSTTGNWEQLRPALDEAISRLGDRDRNAVLLRFFHNQSHREIGAALGLREDAARKCLDRAVERLRANFGRRGVVVPAALLAAAIDAYAVQAAPAGLAATVAGAALAGAVPAGGAAIALGLFNFMSINKITAISSGAVALAIIGFGICEREQARESDFALAAIRNQRDELQVRLRSLEKRAIEQDLGAKPRSTPPVAPARPPVAAEVPPVSANIPVTLAALKEKLAHIGNLAHSRDFQKVGLDEAAVASLRAWVAQDPDTVIQWLSTIPADDFQQIHMIEVMIAIEEGSDPELAFLLANSIGDDASRLNRIGDVLRAWAPVDPVAAARAVQSADIPEATRTVLLSKISQLKAPPSP